MAMLTDDEYKDFEAQIKLQEKVLTSNFLGFTAYCAAYIYGS